AVARMIATTSQLSVHDSVFTPLFVIFGGIITGIVFGAAFNAVSSLIARESEGSVIVYVYALLFLCYGPAGLFGLDELLTSLTMGVIVGNYHLVQEKIIGMIERYIEELIFVLFFTLRGMYLNFSIFPAMLPFVVLYVLLRTLGKYLGAVIGAGMARSPKGLGKNVAWGLILQAGIGLALLIGYDPAFSLISEPAIAVIIGATVVHEIVGPMMFKMALVKAGEIL
ncbi:MAG: cation:proton antiporter, partial [Desulfomonilia bacterium]